MLRFKQYNEGIITPDNLKVKTSSTVKLSKLYNKYNIFFELSDGSPQASYGNYDPKDDSINIQVPKNADLNTLNSVISHELLHREQNKRSGGDYAKWITKYGTGINDYIADFNNKVDLGTSTQKGFDKIEQMRNTFRYGNTFELMAYAFQFVKVRKALGVKSPSELVKFIDASTEVPINKKMKKYIGMYWLIKEQL